MSFSILCVFLSILSESLISEKIYKYDHPCLYKLSSETLMNGGSTNHGTIDNEKDIKKECDGFIKSKIYFGIIKGVHRKI